MNEEELIQELAHKRQILKDLHKRLRPLEQRRAREGYQTPPEVINEINDLKDEIQSCQIEINRLEELAPPMAKIFATESVAHRNQDKHLNYWQVVGVLLIVFLFGVAAQQWIFEPIAQFVNQNANISIHSKKFYSLPYTFGSDKDKASSYLSIRNDEQGIGYDLDYDLPNEGDVYAGLVFSFDEDEDISPYQHIEIVISFDPGASCDLFIKDFTRANTDYIRLGSGVTYGEGITVSINNNIQTIKIPLEHIFKSVNLRRVREIGFSVGVYAPGKNSFIVRDIRFSTR